MNPSNVSPPGTPVGVDPADPNRSAASSGMTSGSKTDNLKQAAQETAQKAKNAASGVAGQLKNKTAEIVGERKEQLADRIGGYSSAIRNSVKSVENEDPNIAWFAQQAADKIQHVSDYVRDRNFTDLRVDAEDFARRHPAVVVGGLFLAGLVVGGALKAGRAAIAENDEPMTSEDYDYNPETTPGEASTTAATVGSEPSEI